MTIKNYYEFVENHVIECDASYRGGTLKVDASSLFDYIDGAVVGAYQNYLGGGMLGAIVGAAMFEPSELHKRDQVKFKKVLEACKRYLHDVTNHEDDEWEAASFEDNQRRPVSAY